MVIRSQEFSYEVLQVLKKDGRGGEYLCQCNGQLCQLICMGQADSIKEFFPILLELEENTAFTDLREYFLDEGLLWLALSWHEGPCLTDYLTEGHGAGERYDLGRQVMEQLILMMMPAYLQCEVLHPERIRVMDGGVPGFRYSFGGWREYRNTDAAPKEGDAKGVAPSGRKALLALEEVLEVLFGEEEKDGLYPEWNSFLKETRDGTWENTLELYKGYLELMTVFAQERKKGKEKKGLWKRLKAGLPRILAVTRIVLGLVVLAAAAAGAAGLWREKAVPVLEAASLWKAVYVDGETMEPDITEPETREETDPPASVEPEPAADPDNGRGERYREDKSLCYRGGLKDGLYDDTGTLYYKDGTVAYQGGFSFGRKEGEGCLYTDSGILFYEGEFKKDQFEGKGRLYDADSGQLEYEGGFAGGRYSGDGVLYDPDTEYPVYVGTFRLGRYDGEGLEYDLSGSLKYEGEFLLGKRHGKGIFYDPATGAALLAGEFRNDIYVGPGDEEMAEVSAAGEGGGDRKAADGEMPADCGEMPADGGEMPADGGEMPAADGEMPADCGDMPADGGRETPASGGDGAPAIEGGDSSEADKEPPPFADQGAADEPGAPQDQGGEIGPGVTKASREGGIEACLSGEAGPGVE